MGAVRERLAGPFGAVFGDAKVHSLPFVRPKPKPVSATFPEVEERCSSFDEFVAAVVNATLKYQRRNRPLLAASSRH